MRRFILFWLPLILILAGLIYLPGLAKYMKLKHAENQLDREIKQIEEGIERLRAEAKLLRTDLSHLEEVSRRELGLVRPGEIVYKVVEETPDTSKDKTAPRS
ncbi:MAG: hypothetical protein A3A73_04250 [Omnitrophica bacterium RIFCSPLOWO2_01_FULL_50_24]|nr:MAG: hypothetical protein A3A73_04250 [Omnitrophica bacterium RIFCSPLOWO2_01_FULL_50_24]